MANWYGIYTRPRWEKKVTEILTKRKIESYCPMHKVTGGWSDRRKPVFEPLFPALVFVRTHALQIDDIKKLDGVINMVYWLNKPAVFRDIELEMVKRFLNEHTTVRLEKTAVSVHEIVKIVSEPFTGSFDNEEKNNAPQKTIKLLLPTLGHTILADVASEPAEILIHNKIRNFNPSLLNIG